MSQPAVGSWQLIFIFDKLYPIEEIISPSYNQLHIANCKLPTKLLAATGQLYH